MCACVSVYIGYNVPHLDLGLSFVTLCMVMCTVSAYICKCVYLCVGVCILSMSVRAFVYSRMFMIVGQISEKSFTL